MSDLLMEQWKRLNEEIRERFRKAREEAQAKAAKVAGVGDGAPTVTNEAGGKQSHVPYRLDLSPALATLHVGGVLAEGAEKYGEDNWRSIPVADHLNHALVHAYAWLAGDRSSDHLGHFACRAMMALELHLAGEAKAAQG